MAWDWGSFGAGGFAAFVLLTAERALRRYRAELPVAPKAPLTGPFSDLGGLKAAEVAALLLGLPDREATLVIAHLDPAFADQALSLLPPGRQEAIIDLLQAYAPPAEAEVVRVANVLRLRMGRPAPPAPPARPATAPLAFLEGMPVETVAAKLNLEHPYLTAYVLTHLPAVTRDRVLALLGAGPRRDVQDLLGRGEPLKLSGEAFVELLTRLRAA